MAKATQRKNSIIAIGRKVGYQGGARARCPYIHPKTRALWLEGWDQGFIARRIELRKQRLKKQQNGNWLQRKWHRFLSACGL